MTTHYCYDHVGNMVERQTGATAETLTYDPDNRLTAISGGSVSASFAYDGDGNRTRATINGVTTLYALDVEYDVATGKLDYYYQADGQRVALRKALGLHYLLNDHLGSTSVLLKTNGAVWGEQRYSAWGQSRYTYGNLSADRQFTGQINDGDTGLYYYNARYYDPALHKFIQADTIVPDPNDPQTLNRFAYTNNNPVKYTDPTGHWVDQGDMGSGRCTPYTCAQGAYYTTYNQNYTAQANHPRCQVNPHCGTELALTTAVAATTAIAAEGAMLGGAVASGVAAASTTVTTGILNAGLALKDGALYVGQILLGASRAATADGDPNNELQAAQQGYTRLYMAVSEAEYQQISRSGGFDVIPQAMSGKWFAESAQHAQMWGQKFYTTGQNFYVIAVDLSDDVANSLFRYASLDGIGPARYAEIEQLLNAVIQGVVP